MKTALYLSNALIYGLGLLYFHYSKYHSSFLLTETKKVLLFLYISYLVFSPLYYYLRPVKTNKSFIFINGLLTQQFSKPFKVAALFLIVKIFFIPMMTNFFVQNLLYLKTNPAFYPLILALIFTIDTGIFSFGYLFEAKELQNKVRSVEPTLFGWAVAIACYPPFNGLIGRIVPWGANEHVTFPFYWGNIILKGVLILLLLFYLSATFALGAKSSNLTNRGIVTKFPYSIVRHPAYIAKNLVWWITLFPMLQGKFVLGMVFWSILYFFRAWTEERHLRSDPDYVEYCKKVKYRFIPGIF